MTLAIRLCVCIRSQYDAVHMPGKPSVMSDSGNILVTMTNTQEPQNTNTSGALAVAKATAGLKLYDTASHAVSSFTPIKPGQVGIYVCGATVQSSPHIGHIRAAVAFDVVRRWFERLGYKVTFVRNVTDIDDKILDKPPPRASSGGSARISTNASSPRRIASLAWSRRRTSRAPPAT